MAELVPLAEELSCSVCLEPFKGPVTTPCGHNFCGACLDETWAVQGPPYLCPQCRAVYQARPQLHKNTVLCAVVEQLLQAGAAPQPPDGGTPAAPAKTGPVACDHCLKAPAVKTCMVCMASFCQEHLQPHLDSPAFQDHQLQPPVKDLLRRKCAEHNRLRDFFCPQHDECICYICLIEHKACSPASLSQASADLEVRGAGGLRGGGRGRAQGGRLGPAGLAGPREPPCAHRLEAQRGPPGVGGWALLGLTTQAGQGEHTGLLRRPWSTLRGPLLHRGDRGRQLMWLALSLLLG